MKSLNKIKLTFFVLILSGACSRSGDSTVQADKFADISGTISPQSGSANEVNNWVVAMLDTETGEARTDTIDNEGNYDLTSVNFSHPQTLALFNADYRLSAWLAVASSNNSDHLEQYFRFKDNAEEIPHLIYRSQTLTMADTTGVSFLNNYSNDENADGIADGMQLAGSSDSAQANSADISTRSSSSSDEDGDGIPNETDFDIDGDGVPNVLDDDDNGNGTMDIFESDANSNGVDDATDKISDRYFKSGLEYMSAQVIHHSDGTVDILMKAQVSAGVNASSITIGGSDALFKTSKIIVKNSAGVETTGDTWKFSLLDDGASYDGAAHDRIYAQKIRLPSGERLRSGHTIFFKLDEGGKIREFPYRFADVTTGSIAFSYTSSSRQITKSGKPFGPEETGYQWLVKVYDSSGKLVSTSPLQDSSTTTYTIPADDVSGSGTFTARIFAESYEKIPGMPDRIIESEASSL